MSALLDLPRVALIACGSFSPPTPMHLRMFEIARDHFEMQATHKVVGGIISPTHDSYGKKGLATALHRCTMVKLALQSSNWIRLSDFEITQTKWSRTHHVLQHHQNYMNNFINSTNSGDEMSPPSHILPGWLPPNLRERKEPVQLRLLCGADLLESFAVPGLWADEDIEDIVANHGLVVITRFGSNPEKFIFESDVLTKHQRNITLITNWVPNEVSSSMVRRLLSRGQSVKYLLDDLVLDYIKAKCLFNYKTKYITDHLPTNQFVNNNRAFLLEQRHINKQQQQQQHSPEDKEIIIERSPTSDTEDDISEEHMDLSDGSHGKLSMELTATNGAGGSASVFCCGETERLPKIVRTQLVRNSPGQAVKVITVEQDGREFTSSISSPFISNDNSPDDNIQRKKLKISNIQEV